MSVPVASAVTNGVELLDELPAPPQVHLTLEHVTEHKDKYLKRIDKLTEKLQLGPDDGEFNVKGWARGKEGGLTCVDYAQLESQKGVMLHLVKSFGSNLMSGKSVVNVSLPVRIFEPRSFLQRIPDAWCYAPVFLTKAAFADTPLERFHYVITFMVAGLHKAVTNTKPFNPILGETFQGCFKDGSQIYLEQTSHHPPISSFELIGPNHIYHVHGSHEFAASLRANSIQGSQIGLTHVDFLDGTRISFHLPYALVRGTVIGDRNFTWMGTCRFTDEKNGFSSDVVFNPDEKSGFTKLFSSQKTPDDHIRGEIYYSGDLNPEVVNPKLAALRRSTTGLSNSSVNSSGSAASSSSSSDMEKKRKEELKKLKKDKEERRDSLNDPASPSGTPSLSSANSASKASASSASDSKECLPTLVSIVEGSWMDGLEFGPPGGAMEPLWTKATIAPFKTILHDNPLPSDCRFREDLIHLVRGNLDEAQKWKSLLEERQREEKNLRKTHEKTVKKRMDSIFKRSTSHQNIKK